MTSWVVAGMVQSEARTLAAEAARLPIDRVEMVDGLNVRLTGFANEEERSRAVAAVAELDSSWDVEGVVDDSAAASQAQGTDESGASTTTQAPAVTAEPASLTLIADTDGSVVLRGTVTSEEVRSALVEAANESLGADKMIDELEVDSAAVVSDGGAVTVTGTAGTEAQKAEWLAAGAALAETGGLNVVDDVAVASVEQQLNALFELEPIEFDTIRASIRPASESTLDEAAAVINANPEAGRLRVVGHTDSDGAADDNLDLSRRRAQAVIDYLVDVGGVDSDRLEADGRGETDLKIDPETSADDKQRNRRIEWEPIS
ncbi:MAG: OmpA family protein [Acidimicrobiia bacterium]|nr:OmpA family protein [Acidimicrobiia bacterium]